MRFTHLMAAASAATLVASPVMAASANPAASLSVAKSARASGTAKKSSELAGGVGIVGLILAAGIVAIPVIAIVKDSDDDSDSN